MTREYKTEPGQKLTEEQIREVEEAMKHPIVCDEDCPKLSPAMQKAFRCAIIQRNRKKAHENSSGMQPLQAVFLFFIHSVP